MRRRKSYIINVLILILLVILALEIILPGQAKNSIEQGFYNEVDAIRNLEVDVEAFPAVKILFDHLDQIHVQASGVKVDNLIIDHLSGQLDNIQLKGNEIIGENTDLNIQITEQALNDYIHLTYPELNQFYLTLNPEKVYLSGYITIFEQRFDLQLAGKLLIKETNLITFIPGNIQVEDFSFSSTLIENYTKDMDFSFLIPEFNFPLDVDKIEIKEGKLYILGGKSLTKVGS